MSKRTLGDGYVIILIFSLCFAVVFFLTKSYRYLDKYYSSVHHVACTAILYQAICGGHLLWRLQDSWFITDTVQGHSDCADDVGPGNSESAIHGYRRGQGEVVHDLSEQITAIA